VGKENGKGSMMGDKNILSGSDENILELVVMVVELCECTKNQ